MILEHINDIASICSGHGVETAIISPGSRSAPLTLAFARHPDIETRIIPDERSAAFVALGIAQVQKKPVVLVCTSGSAAYNYAPAVAEAFFQEIPLIVLTADRPPEWINQYDGQTIQQRGIFGKHVKASFDFPDNPNHKDILWHANRIVNEAVITSQDLPKGPVHINIPLREPFYPDADEKTFFRKVRLIEKKAPELSLSEEHWQTLIKEWKAASKPLIIAGQLPADASLSQQLEVFSKATSTPVISDIISNQQGLSNTIVHQDAFLAPGLDEYNQSLRPDLLITFGKSNISKNLKRFIRKHPPAKHWHIQPHQRYQDTFQSLTRLIEIHPGDFFGNLNERLDHFEANEGFLKSWQSRDLAVKNYQAEFFSKEVQGEFQVISQVLTRLPEESLLHLANSMAVRYANFIGLRGRNIDISCNRGTSGIDGSNSTAVGAALTSDRLVTLITGDMAFFYDRNAFWHNYPLPNLRIVLLNNNAGGIFRLIKGPSDQPELEEFFETKQVLSAANTAKDFGFDYTHVSDPEDLRASLSTFFKTGNQGKILEITTSSEDNAKVFQAYKTGISALFSDLQKADS